MCIFRLAILMCMPANTITAIISRPISIEALYLSMAHISCFLECVKHFYWVLDFVDFIMLSVWILLSIFF